jgi:hypothetical protein
MELALRGVSKRDVGRLNKNVVRRSDNNQMDLNCFFEALEDLANRLFNNQDPYDNLQEVIEIIKKHVLPNPH